MGLVVRFALLCGMAVLTFWKVGPIAAGVLALAAIVVAVLSLIAFSRPANA